MAKIDNLGPLASLENQTSAIQTINDNADKIEAAFDNTLSRDGSGPNHMEASLDMNGHRILNHPAPANNTDLVRWGDLSSLTVIVDGVFIPPQAGNPYKIFSTTGSELIWASPSEIPGLGDMEGANNLSELTNPAAARTALGLGTIATEAAADYAKPASTQTWTAAQTFQGVHQLSGDLIVQGAATSDKSVGFRGSPVITKSLDHTLVNVDSGFTIVYNQGLARTLTIPPNILQVGSFVNVLTLGAGTINLARGSGVTLAKTGVGGDANRTLTQFGMATLYQYSQNNWIAWGTNLT